MKKQLIEKWNKQLSDMNSDIQDMLSDNFDDCDTLAMHYFSTLSESTAIEDMVDELVGELLSEVDSSYENNLEYVYEFDADTTLITYEDADCLSKPQEVTFNKGVSVLLYPCAPPENYNYFASNPALLVIEHINSNTPSLVLSGEFQRGYYIQSDQVEELIQ